MVAWPQLANMPFGAAAIVVRVWRGEFVCPAQELQSSVQNSRNRLLFEAFSRIGESLHLQENGGCRLVSLQIEWSAAQGAAGSSLFRARLDQIVDLGHPLAKLGRAIDWRFLEERFGAVYSDNAGHPPLPTRLIAGLSILKHILKHMHDLSDEDLCALG